MTEQPDHELEVLEDDQDVPPRPEESIADAGGGSEESAAEPSSQPGPRTRTPT